MMQPCSFECITFKSLGGDLDSLTNSTVASLRPSFNHCIDHRSRKRSSCRFRSKGMIAMDVEYYNNGFDCIPWWLADSAFVQIAKTVTGRHWTSLRRNPVGFLQRRLVNSVNLVNFRKRMYKQKARGRRGHNGQQATTIKQHALARITDILRSQKSSPKNVKKRYLEDWLRNNSLLALHALEMCVSLCVCLRQTEQTQASPIWAAIRGV